MRSRDRRRPVPSPLARTSRYVVMRLSLTRAWRTDLPRVVLFLQAGNAFSWFGYGLILPFEIIYLHQFRGFSTATAGLVLAAILGAGTVVTPPSGALLDHFRPKGAGLGSVRSPRTLPTTPQPVKRNPRSFRTFSHGRSIEA